MSVFSCYFTNIFLFVESTENSKKEEVCYKFNSLSHYVFWYECDNFRAYVFFIHACGKFHVLNIYVMKLD